MSRAARRTEKASNERRAAVNQAHTVRGRRSQVMPSQRSLRTVVRVLTEERQEAMAKRAMEASQRSMPAPWPGPAAAIAERGG